MQYDIKKNIQITMYKTGCYVMKWLKKFQKGSFNIYKRDAL